jgi:hypothetical protein
MSFYTTNDTRFVTVSMTTPTDALDAGDVVAATQVVSNVTKVKGRAAVLSNLTLIDTDDQKANLNVVFFNANTSLGTEDAAPDIDDTEVLTVVGYVSILSTDWLDLGGAAVVTKNSLNIVLPTATDSDDLYMAIYTPATSTPTYASGIITAKLGFL